MKVKPVVTILLLGFVVASIAFLVVKESGGTAGTPSDVAGSPGMAPGRLVDAVMAGAPTAPLPRSLVVWYVHGNKRCNTCRAIERQSREALESGFPEALMSGRLEWRDVNADEAGNERFYTDFQLTGSSLLLVDFQDGKQARFKVLQKAWELAADPSAFTAYVQSEVRPWLEVP